MLCKINPKKDKFKLKKWLNPLFFASQISCSNYNQNWVFLYSGLNKKIKNSKSYLCLYPKKEIISQNFEEIDVALKSSQERYFGYFGYELKNQLENSIEAENSIINLPNLWLINFKLVLEFNHQKKQVFGYGNEQLFLNLIKDFLTNKEQKDQLKNEILVENISSNFSKLQFLKKVQTIQEKIVDGDIYQANLTRKFFGKFNKAPTNPFSIFLKLNKNSPANYSSFLKLEKNYIISSSPELFLKINKNKVKSCPIKGTAKKSLNKKLDKKSKQDLKNNPKEQAENLMIVDLVRNDLSKHCLASSVMVKNLFKVSSYKTLHHLSSEIWGIKKPNSSNLDIIKSCFPAGSMTGAPKIKAMEICQMLETQKRGVYSGAVGFIDQKKSDLSVVIRTLIIRREKFEFQVGGAITFDSNPKKEWQETINKAKGISKSLKIKLSELKNL